VVVAAMRQTGGALEYVDKTADFWKEKKVVLPIVHSAGIALQYASDSLSPQMELRYNMPVKGSGKTNLL